MRKIGRSIAWLLSVALLFGQLPMQTFAEEAGTVQTSGSISGNDVGNEYKELGANFN